MPGMAADVIALLDRLGIARFHYAGVSIGGAIGQQLAIDHGDRLLSLTVCASAARFADPDSWPGRAATVRAEGTGAMLASRPGTWFTHDFAREQPGEAQRLLDMLQATSGEGYAGCCEAIAAFDVRARLGEVRTPTLAVAGAEDPATPPDTVRVIADGIPGAAFHRRARRRTLAQRRAAGRDQRPARRPSRGRHRRVGAGMNKVVDTAAAAVADIADGASLAVGGFGMSGVPTVLIAALLEQGATDLETVSNNLGVDGFGLGTLLAAGRIRRTIGSYVGNNKEFARQYLAGELELELTPQGTLAERLRAGGAGVPAFYTPAGVGTLVADGGLPWRYAPDGTVAVTSPPKEVREFDGVRYVLERAIVADFALVHAWKGDRHGNLVYRRSAANFNPDCAAAGRITIAQVEHLVEPGEIDPDAVHTPGIHVQRVLHVPGVDKPVEFRTIREKP
jgi:3-oxoacid CoA-transferase, A subunit